MLDSKWNIYSGWSNNQLSQNVNLRSREQWNKKDISIHKEDKRDITEQVVMTGWSRVRSDKGEQDIFSRKVDQK